MVQCWPVKSAWLGGAGGDGDGWKLLWELKVQHTFVRLQEVLKRRKSVTRDLRRNFQEEITVNGFVSYWLTHSSKLIDDVYWTQFKIVWTFINPSFTYEPHLTPQKLCISKSPKKSTPNLIFSYPKQKLLKNLFFSRKLTKLCFRQFLLYFTYLLTFLLLFIELWNRRRSLWLTFSLPTGMWNAGEKCKQFRFSLDGICITRKCSNWILAFRKLFKMHE